MMSGSSIRGISVGEIQGIPITLQHSCFILLAVEVFAVMWQYNEPVFTFLMFLLYGPVLLGTILIHELGHAFTTKRLGGKVEGILLSPLGGFALCGPTNGNVVEDLWVALAGPLAHIPQAIFWIALYFVLNQGKLQEHFAPDININYLKQGGFVAFWSIIAIQAAMMNVTLLVFNLAIPAYPMDGGRCLAALLIMCGASTYSAAMVTSMTAMLVGCAFCVVGFYPVWSVSGMLLAFFGVFIMHSSLELRRMTMRGQVHEHPLFDRACYRVSSSKSKPFTSINDSSHGDAIENLISIV